jgi:hypothetical protein
MEAENLGKPKMPGNRGCGTCLYYEPSPLRRKGWCRNPNLVDGYVKRLVELNEYNCYRMFSIDFWEPAPQAEITTSSPATAQAFFSRLTALAHGDGVSKPNSKEKPDRSSGQEVELPVVPGFPVGENRPRASQLQLTAWRPTRAIIMLLVAIVLVPLLSFAAWTSYQTVGARETSPEAIGGAAPTNSPAQTLLQPTATAIQKSLPPAPTMASGGYAQVVNTDSGGLQVRLQPGPQYPAVASMPDGTILHLIDGPVNAEGYIWWQVEADGQSGWCADTWLKAVAGPSG